MKSNRFKIKDIFEFIVSKKYPCVFMTICSKEDASFTLDDGKPVYIKANTYEEDVINQIIEQSKEWSVKVVRTEDWDPSMYSTGKVVKETYQDINPATILVKESSFAGLIDYTTDGEDYIVSCALIEEYESEPMLFCYKSGFGSSDRDMMYNINYYLTKKNLHSN